jgi:ABC-2 type transport system permease protein
VNSARKSEEAGQGALTGSEHPIALSDTGRAEQDQSPIEADGWAEAHPSPGMASAVWKLLRLRIVILVRGFLSQSTGRKILTVFAGLVLAAMLVGGFIVMGLFINLLNDPRLAQVPGELNRMMDSLPALIISGAFFGILFTSFYVLLQVLYMSGDMDFLLSAPLPIRAVFIAKLLQAILPNFAFICLFAVPMLVAVGLSEGFSPLYYPAVLLILAALALAAAGIASLLVMFAVRLLPARHVAEVLGLVGALVSLFCSQSMQLVRWDNLPPDQAMQTLNRPIGYFNTPYSPLAWVARGLSAVGTGDWLFGSGMVALTLVLSGLVFAIALKAAEGLYYSGWANMQSVSRRRKARRPRDEKKGATAAVSEQLTSILPRPVRAILLKDWLVLRRDLRNMTHLIAPLMVGIVYMIMIFGNRYRSTSSPGEMPAQVAVWMHNAGVYVSAGLSLFVSWMLLSRLAGTGFAQEGKSYWMLKAAPVGTTSLLAAKYLAAYLPALALSWLYLLVAWGIQGAPVSVLLYSLPATALCIGGNAGLNLAFGVGGANLGWEDPRQMQRAASSCLMSLSSMVYLPLALLLFFGPPVAIMAFGLPDVIGQVAGLFLGGMLSLTCAVVPLLLVRKRVERLGEA